MQRYNHNRRYREPSVLETLKVAIKRNSVERNDSEFRHHRSNRSPQNAPVVVDADEIQDLIPIFRGDSSKTHAKEWIDIVEDIREIYEWDDRLTLVYATLRLQDEAKRWYKENLCQNWHEFKMQFVNRFVAKEITSKSEMLEQLVTRKKENGETYENYVFGIERIALKCGCSVEATINYIILGITDKSLKNKLINSNCISVDELLELINKFTKDNNEDLRNQLGRRNHSQERNYAAKDDGPKRKKKLYCRSCKRHGHSYETCFFLTKFCEHCQNGGHNTEDCRLKATCPNCHVEGHGRATCPTSEVVCYFCYEKGHWAQVCQARKAAFDKFRDEERREDVVSQVESVRSDDLFCRICKREDHNTEDCCNFEQSSRGASRERSRYCGICKRDDHKTKHCPEMERPKRNNIKCRICHEFGHGTRDCKVIEDGLLIKPNDKKLNRAMYCRKCKQTGHYTRNCTQREPSAEKNIIVFCRNCKMEGHATRDCHLSIKQERPSQGSGSDEGRYGYCRTCKIEGHSTRDCKFTNSDRGRELESRNSRPRGTSFRDGRSSSLDFERGRSINTPGFSRMSSPERVDNFCGNCNMYGHNRGNCKVLQNVMVKPSSSDHNHALFCRLCRKGGHYTRDCKSMDSRDNRRHPAPAESKVVGYCRKCKVEGHATRECKAQRSERSSSRLRFSPKRSSSRSRFSPKRSSSRSRFSPKRQMDRYCRICKKEGHFTRDCKYDSERETICRICDRRGHSTRDCKERMQRKEDSKREHNRTIENSPPSKKPRLAVKPLGTLVGNQPGKTELPKEDLPSSTRANRNLGELLKPARIDDVYMTALVNLGSDCTTLQKSEFERHDWKMEPCSLEINGFAAGTSRTLGKITKAVGIGEVSLVIDILIVDDDIQDFPLVVGSNFLDHPSICVIKKYRSLEIKWVEMKKEVEAPKTNPVAMATATASAVAVNPIVVEEAPMAVVAPPVAVHSVAAQPVIGAQPIVAVQPVVVAPPVIQVQPEVATSVMEEKPMLQVKSEPFEENEEDKLLKLLNAMDQDMESQYSQPS